MNKSLLFAAVASPLILLSFGSKPVYALEVDLWPFDNKGNTQQMSTQTINRTGYEGLGRRGLFLEKKAEFLGITTEELRAMLEDGKTLREIAEEMGKTIEDLHEFHKQEVAERMEERGASPEEIEERLGAMDEHFAECQENPDLCVHERRENRRIFRNGLRIGYKAGQGDYGIE